MGYRRCGAGALCVVVGVGVIYWPAALILSGAVLCYLYYLRESRG
jgi:hypothetical protein